MAETTYPAFQALIDAAFETYDQRKSYDDFLFDLPGHQRMAILLKDLNYQVENGGFAQWLHNRYGEHADDVRRVLRRIGTPAASNAENLVLIACQAWRQYGDKLNGDDLDAQDTAYYKLSAQLLADAEAYFAGLVSA